MQKCQLPECWLLVMVWAPAWMFYVQKSCQSCMLDINGDGHSLLNVLSVKRPPCFGSPLWLITKNSGIVKFIRSPCFLVKAQNDFHWENVLNLDNFITSIRQGMLCKKFNVNFRESYRLETLSAFEHRQRTSSVISSRGNILEDLINFAITAIE